MKKIIRSVILSMVVVLAIVAVIASSLKFEEKTTEKKIEEEKEIVLIPEEVEENLENFTSESVSSDVTLKSLENLTNNEHIDISHAMYGKDASTNETVDKDLKGNLDLSAYEKVQKKLVKKLEKKMQDSYTYEYTTDFIYEEPTLATRGIKFTSYLYCYYYNDVSYLMGYLMEKSGYDGNETYKEYIIGEYKAKIKAMQILDSHLDDYVSDEVYEMELIYVVNDGEMACFNCEKYLEYLKGFHSSRIQDYPEERMENFMNEGLKKGILKEGDLLAI